MKNKPIKNWPEDERPREKLLKYGPSVLTDSEILAIIIGSGTKDKSAVDLAKEILENNNYSFDNLAKLKVEDFKLYKGLGTTKAITIIAALEIGRRRKKSNNDEIYNSPDKIYNLISPDLADLNCEETWVIFLNNSLKLIRKEKISQGGLNSSLVDIRVILKRALLLEATGIILCHNHPSGNIQPSSEDISITKKLQEAANLLSIKLLDHIIVTQNDFYSFSENGIL